MLQGIFDPACDLVAAAEWELSGDDNLDTEIALKNYSKPTLS
jgi:hypothetical protein